MNIETVMDNLMGAMADVADEAEAEGKDVAKFRQAEAEFAEAQRMPD